MEQASGEREQISLNVRHKIWSQVRLLGHLVLTEHMFKNLGHYFVTTPLHFQTSSIQYLLLLIVEIWDSQR